MAPAAPCCAATWRRAHYCGIATGLIFGNQRQSRKDVAPNNSHFAQQRRFCRSGLCRSRGRAGAFQRIGRPPVAPADGRSEGSVSRPCREPVRIRQAARAIHQRKIDPIGHEPAPWTQCLAMNMEGTRCVFANSTIWAKCGRKKGLARTSAICAPSDAPKTMTIISTLSRTNSAANSAKRSLRPSAQRYSVTMLRPSIQPTRTQPSRIRLLHHG
jgi:hypothetical protein